MTFSDGYTELPPGKIASVVTYLEMRQAPIILQSTSVPGLACRKVPHPDLSWYRDLYRAVGQDWLWFNRLRMSDEELGGTIRDPKMDIYALTLEGSDKGLLELDRRIAGEVEIAYFGVTADLVGRGAGQFLMQHALAEAWSHAPQRVWVHTCTLDHPRALSFYLKAGFIPYKRAIEISDDPRLTGNAPRTAAPHVPLLVAEQSNAEPKQG